jgi:hypothetical protein
MKKKETSKDNGMYVKSKDKPKEKPKPGGLTFGEALDKVTKKAKEKKGH